LVVSLNRNAADHIGYFAKYSTAVGVPPEVAGFDIALEP
jgi:hypothetical protein